MRRSCEGSRPKPVRSEEISKEKLQQYTEEPWGVSSVYCCSDQRGGHFQFKPALDDPNDRLWELTADIAVAGK